MTKFRAMETKRISSNCGTIRQHIIYFYRSSSNCWMWAYTEKSNPPTLLIPMLTLDSIRNYNFKGQIMIFSWATTTRGHATVTFLYLLFRLHQIKRKTFGVVVVRCCCVVWTNDKVKWNSRVFLFILNEFYYKLLQLIYFFLFNIFCFT